MKDFVLISKTEFPFPPTWFQSGDFIHKASFVRGFKQYMCFVDRKTGLWYVEEVSDVGQQLFKLITDESEWQDCVDWLRYQGILTVDKKKEFEIGHVEK